MKTKNKQITQNRMWVSTVPAINFTFLVISGIFILVVDLPILFSSPGLFPFFIEMLVVLGIFLLFIKTENGYFKKKLSHSKSKLDGWILFLIVLRNLVFFLNFIPFIQILGIMMAAIGILPYLVLYSGFMDARVKSAKAR